MINKPVGDHCPGTPTRTVKKASGGGSKKLQQLLGASESDIDLLLRPAEILSTQTHRVSSNFERNTTTAYSRYITPCGVDYRATEQESNLTVFTPKRV